MIIGTERSGSNLLRLVLNSHRSVAIPHPPHFMRYLAPLAPAYGDLREERNRRALTRDALTLLRVHIHPWEHPVDEDLVVATASPTLFGVVAAIYEQYRVAEGKPRWGCKSTFMVEHHADVLVEYPDARFVWLVRDPRDVAVSAKRAVFGPYHPRLTAELWERQQRCGLEALNQYGPGVVHLLRYEDLVVRPEEEVAKLCAFAGESFEPEMLAFHRSEAAQRTARLSESWRNTDRPIANASVGQYQQGLTAAEQRQVEHAAAPMMRRLGYPVGDGAYEPGPYDRAVVVRGRDIALRALVEYRSIRSDANCLRRWRRDAIVAWLRLKAAGKTLQRPREMVSRGRHDR
jgi:hypothetical protein